MGGGEWKDMEEIIERRSIRKYKKDVIDRKDI